METNQGNDELYIEVLICIIKSLTIRMFTDTHYLPDDQTRQEVVEEALGSHKKHLRS